MQNKKPFEIILLVGRVTSLQSWLAKKSCHGQILINECSISDYPSKLALHAILFQTVFCFAFLGSYIFISDQKVKARSSRNRNCICDSRIIRRMICESMLSTNAEITPMHCCLGEPGCLAGIMLFSNRLAHNMQARPWSLISILVCFYFHVLPL